MLHSSLRSSIARSPSPGGFVGRTQTRSASVVRGPTVFAVPVSDGPLVARTSSPSAEFLSTPAEMLVFRQPRQPLGTRFAGSAAPMDTPVIDASMSGRLRRPNSTGSGRSGYRRAGTHQPPNRLERSFAPHVAHSAANRVSSSVSKVPVVTPPSSSSGLRASSTVKAATSITSASGSSAVASIPVTRCSSAPSGPATSVASAVSSSPSAYASTTASKGPSQALSEALPAAADASEYSAHGSRLLASGCILGGSLLAAGALSNRSSS